MILKSFFWELKSYFFGIFQGQSYDRSSLISKTTFSRIFYSLCNCSFSTKAFVFPKKAKKHFLNFKLKAHLYFHHFFPIWTHQHIAASSSKHCVKILEDCLGTFPSNCWVPKSWLGSNFPPRTLKSKIHNINPNFWNPNLLKSSLPVFSVFPRIEAANEGKRFFYFRQFRSWWEKTTDIILTQRNARSGIRQPIFN